MKYIIRFVLFCGLFFLVGNLTKFIGAWPALFVCLTYLIYRHLRDDIDFRFRLR